MATVCLQTTLCCLSPSARGQECGGWGGQEECMHARIISSFILDRQAHYRR